MTKREIKAERKLKIEEFSKQRQEEFINSRNGGVSPLKVKQPKFIYKPNPFNVAENQYINIPIETDTTAFPSGYYVTYEDSN